MLTLRVLPPWSLVADPCAALRSGGWLAVSFERHDGNGWTLRPSRRHAHSMTYVAATAAEAGFETVALISTTLRSEAGAPVRGFFAIYRRAD